MQASPTHNPPSLAATGTNAQLNLSVLQRHNPSIIHVLSIAPYTVIYTFSTTSQTWEKAGIEGTLFVVQLSPPTVSTQPANQERYSVFVLNRRGLDNFELELRSVEDIEITDDYIILQDTELDVIYGLWVFAEPPPSSTAEMRSVNAKVIQDCAARAEASRSAAPMSEQRIISPNMQRQHHQQQQPWSTHPQPSLATTAPTDSAAQNMARQLSLRELFGQQQQQQQQQQLQPYPSQHSYPAQLQNNQHQYAALGDRRLASPFHQQQEQQPAPQQYQQQQPHQYQKQQPLQYQQQQYQQHPVYHEYSSTAFRFPSQQGNQYEQFHYQQSQQPQPAPQAHSSISQQDVLGGLFQRARQGYSYT